ncbi:MAG TPA: PQQ-binding-like beta-propeller repeat protein [Rhizomicrobium sp.]|jgi:quinoprotein glucose dehydrogenase
MRRKLISASLLLLGTPAFAAPGDWSIYGGENGTRYSQLIQITKGNVQQLQQAWSFPMDAAGDPQTHPLAIGGIIYAYTPSLQVIALDGATGKLLWTFDAAIPGRGPQRGLSWWTDGKQQRLFASVMNWLYALDPATGKPLADFGEGGRIDMLQGLGGEVGKYSLSLTSPGTVYKDMIITGFRTAESAPAAPGDIRAFDVHSGKLRWAFHTIPRPGEYGHETWPADAWKTAGGANNWTGMVLDEKRGMIFAPTGSAVDDFYGTDRAGNDLFANTLLALDANTGKRLWHFQGVHHDVQDRDFPSPPVLLTVRHDGRMVDAVAQPTKTGFLFVLDRVTGKPLFPITETPVPQSDVSGEATSPTQPMASLPTPYARQQLTEDLLTSRTPQAHAWALTQFKTFNNTGPGASPFAPMRVGQQTVVFPGFDGGAEWGGSAADPGKGIIYINANDIAWTGGLTESVAAKSLGAATYQARCAACHGADRRGAPPAFPSLVDIGQRLAPSQIASVLQTGRGRMPSFPNITGDALQALLDYLATGKDEGPQKEMAGPATASSKYRFTGYRKFLDPDGYPAVAPPWGTLNAIDLNTGQYLWKIPLGEYPELAAKGATDTGSENYGGPILTASGLLFIAATLYDKKIRAFDSASGQLLWQTTLPFAGNATPITYMARGRQFVLIQTDNARDKKAPRGAAYVAFALPENNRAAAPK